MTIIHMSVLPVYRLRLESGGYVFMTWNHFHGPDFYHDKAFRREFAFWYAEPEIGAALEWFINRGNKA